MDTHELRKLQRKNDLEWLMRQPQGRRFLLPVFAEAERRPWTPDAHAASYNAGRHEAARALLDELRAADINLFHALEHEYQGARRG